MDVGKNIRQIRTDLKWSQEELGHITGLSKSMISQMERGVKTVMPYHYKTFANAFGIKISKLLGIEE